METDKMLKWVEFVATKFDANHIGWTYKRGTESIKRIRYSRDNQGCNHWTKRAKRMVRDCNPVRYFQFQEKVHPMFRRERTLKAYLLNFRVSYEVHWKLPNNLPDGTINGIITHWEEDGEYIAAFQPRVGMKVLEFIKDNPENPYAQAIVAEMKACVELSWPEEENNED